jgi:small subunit ribosomal protein S5
MAKNRESRSGAGRDSGSGDSGDSNRDEKRKGKRDSKKSDRARTEKESEWQERVVVVGNEKGQVGVGVGKAADVINAVKKGVADARKHAIDVPLTKSNSIPHPTNGIGGGAKVMIRPASPGTGVIAGGAVRTVLELAGVKNILAKQLGSSSPLNNARAAINALATLRTFGEVARARGITLEQLFN